MSTTTSSDKSVDFKLYRYDPNMAATVIFIVLFATVTILHTYQLLRTRTWYFIPFVVGGYFQVIGYFGRAISAQQSPDWTVLPYIIYTIPVLVAPALYAASIYMELGRIILLTDGEVHAIVRKKWLTKIFVVGDVISFIMQGAGGGIMASGTHSALQTGENIIIGGLVIQIIFFSLFAVTGIIFHVRMLRVPTATALAQDGTWQKHLNTLYIGSALIWVRCMFRLIEYAQGNDGYLISHEVYLYIFDAVLMFATMVLFAVVHPSEINALVKGGGGKSVRKLVSIYELN